jgi:hypothetical protein
MKKIVVVLAVFLTIALIPNAMSVFDWTGTAISSGYAVTTDWHGEMVPLGEPVTAWAGTTDLSIEEVKFRWLYPNGSDFVIVQVTSYIDEEWNGLTVREFNNTQTLNVIGDWGVQGLFYDDEGQGQGPIPEQPYPVAIRARSFFQVPEVYIGTIAAMLAMFAALGIIAIKKKRTH